MKFKIIQPAELIEYENIIAKYGYKKSHFSISEETSLAKTSPSNIVPEGGITIYCRLSKKKKTYIVSIGNPWPKQFAEDLKNGIFDSRNYFP